MRYLPIMTLFTFLLALAGCGSGDRSGQPGYAAKIVDMSLTPDVLPASSPAKIAPRLAFLNATSSTSQDFSSGNIKYTVGRLGLHVQVRNDSPKPASFVYMGFWDPAGYPYPADSTTDQHGLIKFSGTLEAAQPGETITIDPEFALGSGHLQYPQLLGNHAVSLWVFAAPPNWEQDYGPYFWLGTIQRMQDFIAAHTPLARGTTHFTLVQPNYTDLGDGTTKDEVTGLIWQNRDDGIKRTWQEAVSYCSSLSQAGAVWRLPTVTELLTLVDTSFFNYPHPSIDTYYFPDTQPSQYWSLSMLPGTPWAAFTGHFDFDTLYGEGAGFDLTSRLFYVRCVQ
ncbi:hypothetical protein GMLC_15930 [Geomonas limicola]|uniref:Lcl C-terminal domain-containing protein n=1 Tax=Geomonas limicola TaxID=2740186 RepID=A0A6V8N7T8_9BACT|nr:DUF1566 domain-containing protein [Geomonas limicola]GFO68014.1 hypothetical protein GMLC_15930 [Geomonas limicola]